ncbi:MAG: hypothetical protein LBQ44_01195 [Treponema sp.]|jgi:hypothetical protein|nr:hypothetical protein [Treponema sp.]
MTVEEFCGKLDTLVSGLNSGTAQEDTFSELAVYSAEAEKLGMKTAKQLLENLHTVLKNRKEGGASEGSVAIRLTALEFYVKKLQSGSTEDL